MTATADGWTLLSRTALLHSRPTWGEASNVTLCVGDLALAGDASRLFDATAVKRTFSLVPR
ncbi:hypothetical protein A4R29_30280 (plasmid) [Mesorhizobium ciceri biovar biserrulae]|nr:hypothetical protein A4R28_30675 [Mesorhizobium ciceri]AMY03983.1 hypothetical protein A4R29_30280 [Mesorhizobium ciceri biovar biserrulae]